MRSVRAAAPLVACAAAALGLHLLLFDLLQPVPAPREAPRAPPVTVRTIEVAPPAVPVAEVAPPPAPKPQRAVAAARTAPASIPAPTVRQAAAVPVAAVDASTVADEPDAPVYATRIPGAALLRFRMQRGMLSGTATLSWSPTPQAYEARLEARVAGALVLEQVSRGGFDAAGLAPERFTDRRVRRGTVAANFQRDAARLSYSGTAAEYPLSAGLQDRLSWLLQIAAIAEADPAAMRPGASFALRVTGARGDLSTWVLRVAGEDTVPGSDPSRAAWRLVRAPRGPHDGGAEVWLDPQHAHLPLRVVLHGGEGDGRAALELDRVSISMPP